LGLEEGHVPARTVSSNQDTFDITAGQNDLMVFELNGVTVEAQLDPGFLFAHEVRDQIAQAIVGSQISYHNYSVESTEDGRVSIQASESLKILDSSTSTANSELGFSSGWVNPELSGNLFRPSIKAGEHLRISVDGRKYEISLRAGTSPIDQIAEDLEQGTDETLSVDHEEGGDYAIDYETGKIEFLTTFDPHTSIYAAYQYPGQSSGPYAIRENHSNNDAIPGCVLAFGNRVRDRDKLAVVVHNNREDVAAEYGGRWEINVDLDVISKDPSTRAEMIDGLLSYFFTIRKSALSEEGIELTDISSGGESEEEDGNGRIYFMGSLSMTFQTDWALHIPKPLTIETVEPTSLPDRLREADGGDQAESQVRASDEFNLDQINNAYIVGKNRDFEKIK
jgi:hypothetical protein